MFQLGRYLDDLKFNKLNFSVNRKVKEIKLNKNNIEFGKVLENNGKTIIVKTYDGAIEILEHNFKELPKAGEYL